MVYFVSDLIIIKYLTPDINFMISQKFRRIIQMLGAVFVTNLQLNYRRYLLHREALLIVIFLLIEFINLKAKFLSENSQNSGANKVIIQQNIIILIFMSRSAVIEYASHKNKYFLYQKAYGINEYVYLAAWYTYSIVFGLIKIALVISLTVAFLQYEYQFDPNVSFEVSQSTIFLSIFASFFSFYAYTLFFYTIIPHNFLSLRLITPFLMNGIFTSYIYNALVKDVNSIEILLNPSEWFQYIFNFKEESSQGVTFSYNQLRNIVIYQSLIPFFVAVLIEIIKIKRFEIKNWIFNRRQPKNQVLNEDLLDRQSVELNEPQPKIEILSACNISKMSGKQIILKNISFTVYEGEMILLLGENGSGKSSLLKVLSSIDTLDVGTIKRKDDLIVGACLQNNYLYDQLTVKENLYFYGQIKGIRNLNKKIMYLLESFELNEFSQKEVFKLSGGNRKKLSLSLSFLGKSSLIIIEEPTIGVDLVVKKEIWRILAREKAKRKKLSFIVASSDPQIELFNMADRFIVLREGSIVADHHKSIISEQSNTLTVNLRNIELSTAVTEAISQMEENKTAKLIESNMDGANIFELSLKNWALFQDFLKKFDLLSKIEQARLEDCRDALKRLTNASTEIKEHQSTLLAYMSVIQQVQPSKSYLQMIWGCILIRITALMPTPIDIIFCLAVVPFYWILTYLSFFQISSFWISNFSSFFPLYCYYLYPQIYYSEVKAKQQKFEEMMIVHGLKKRLYWIVSIFVDAFIVCIGYTQVMLISWGVLVKSKWGFNYQQYIPYENGLLYILSSVTVIKVWTLFFTRSYISFIFFPFIITAIQTFIFVLLDNSLYFDIYYMKNFTYVGNVFLPILTFAASSSWATFYYNFYQQLIGYYWSTYIYFASQFVTYSFFIVVLPALFFYNRIRQKRINFQKVKVLNCDDKINQKLRVIDNKEENLHKYEISIQGLSLQYGPKNVPIKDMYLGLGKKTVFGLLGRNGSGKSTTLKLTTSLIDRTTGRIYFNNEQITQQSSSIYESVGFCPQFDYFQPFMTVERHIKIILIFKNVPFRKHKDITKAILDVFGMIGTLKRKIRVLSDGEKAKLKIATALLCNPQPKYLFLDEPTVCLDIRSQQIFCDILGRISSEFEATIIYITHKVSEVQGLCNRVGILQRGEFINLATPKELIDEFSRGFTITIQTVDLKVLKEHFYPQIERLFQVFEWSEDEQKRTIKVSIPSLYFSMKTIIELVGELKAKQLCSYFCLKKDGFEEVFDYLSSRTLQEEPYVRPRQTELSEMNRRE